MSETLPNWNLKDFYLSIDDKQIEFELKKLIEESKNLIEYNLSEIETRPLFITLA